MLLGGSLDPHASSIVSHCFLQLSGSAGRSRESREPSENSRSTSGQPGFKADKHIFPNMLALMIWSSAELIHDAGPVLRDSSIQFGD